jgi:transcriptional regulator with XRE-family HTH domain
LNISQASISNYESGATTPDIAVLKRIADYFQVPITYLLLDNKPILHSNENNGERSDSMNNTINIISEKLIELYELRLKEKDELIAYLKRELKAVNK